jgi:serpin B
MSTNKHEPEQKMKSIRKMVVLGCLLAALACAPVCEAASYSMDMLAEGNTTFALNLYSTLIQNNNDNLFFSPYSVSTALAMTYAGARGNTKAQMAAALQFPSEGLSRETVHAAFLDLQANIQKIGSAGNIQLDAANSLWPDKKYTFLPGYLEFLQKYYGVTITPMDFERTPEIARTTINKWVEEKTRDKITNLIPSGALDQHTRLVLANAIYFKGKWAFPFNAAQTENAPFHVVTNEYVTTKRETKNLSVPARMMAQTKAFKYAEFDTLQVIALPYVGEELSMVVLLPSKETTLSQLEGNLNAGNWSKWRRALDRRDVQVFLPRFKMTWQASLVPAMQALGITDAFRGAADFSGMDGTQSLFISDILHKAFVDVAEEGTEAAAATGVAIHASSSAMRAPPPVFRADHPFLFVIQEDRTGSILFIGRVMNPQL